MLTKSVLVNVIIERTLLKEVVVVQAEGTSKDDHIACLKGRAAGSRCVSAFGRGSFGLGVLAVAVAVGLGLELLMSFALVVVLRAVFLVDLAVFLHAASIEIGGASGCLCFRCRRVRRAGARFSSAVLRFVRSLVFVAAVVLVALALVVFLAAGFKTCAAGGSIRLGFRRVRRGGTRFSSAVLRFVRSLVLVATVVLVSLAFVVLLAAGFKTGTASSSISLRCRRVRRGGARFSSAVLRFVRSLVLVAAVVLVALALVVLLATGNKGLQEVAERSLVLVAGIDSERLGCAVGGARISAKGGFLAELVVAGCALGRLLFVAMVSASFEIFLVLGLLFLFVVMMTMGLLVVLGLLAMFSGGIKLLAMLLVAVLLAAVVVVRLLGRFSDIELFAVRGLLAVVVRFLGMLSGIKLFAVRVRGLLAVVVRLLGRLRDRVELFAVLVFVFTVVLRVLGVFLGRMRVEMGTFGRLDIRNSRIMRSRVFDRLGFLYTVGGFMLVGIDLLVSGMCFIDRTSEQIFVLVKVASEKLLLIVVEATSEERLFIVEVTSLKVIFKVAGL